MKIVPSNESEFSLYSQYPIIIHEVKEEVLLINSYEQEALETGSTKNVVPHDSISIHKTSSGSTSV